MTRTILTTAAWLAVIAGLVVAAITTNNLTDQLIPVTR